MGNTAQASEDFQFEIQKTDGTGIENKYMTADRLHELCAVESETCDKDEDKCNREWVNCM